MRVSFPRVLCVRRRDPYRLSVGDSATAEFGPGLLEFLSLRDARGDRLGDGLAPEWTIPIAAATTAAYAVVGEQFNRWTASSNTIDWKRPAADGEWTVGTATIQKMLPVSIQIGYRIVGRESQDLIGEGTLVFVSVNKEGPTRYTADLLPPRAPEPGASAATSPPPQPTRVKGPRSWKSRAAAAVLAPSLIDTLRQAYWHALSLRVGKTDPGEFLRGFGRILNAAGPQREDATASARPLIRWNTAAIHLAPKESTTLTIQVRNGGEGELGAGVEVKVPFGFGLAVDWTRSAALWLLPGQTAELSVRVEALRPDEVNLGRPWPLTCVLRSGGRELASDSIAVSVPDPEPGDFYYVLTEDCETFDGGEKTGDYPTLKTFGNQNNFMDPEEYRVQMIQKPDALNAIADKHGAKWTHYWTVPQRFAAQWAAGRSGTGVWAGLVRELDDSIRRGSRRHEYAPHIHFDFEPESKLPPQPRLLYDPATDGILPNEYYDPQTNPDHKYHGWDGARKGIAYVRREGSLSDPDSKIGSLRKAMRYLAGLSFTGRLALTVRTGAADFGAAPEDLAASRKAAFANGLLADSDFGIYERTPLPRGRQIYFCSARDLGTEISDLADASLVQLRAPDVNIESGTEEMNAWFSRRYWESRGPGVRAAVAMTHAMFLKGSPDPFRDAKGGDFEALDHHLDHVRRLYPDVRFATASEATLEFLDYYTPTPRAVATRLKARSKEGATLIYAIRILGKGIPISEARPASLTIQAPPLFDPSDIRSMTVLDHGVPVADSAWAASGGELPSATFSATHRDGYDLRIDTVRPMGDELSGFPADAPAPGQAAIFEEPAEEERPDLLRLDRPVRTRGEGGAEVREGNEWEWIYPHHLFDVLVHPLAGGEHPLGRRLHPYGRISEGMAIHAAMRQFGDAVRPLRFELKWIRPIFTRADFQLVARVARVTPDRLEVDSSIRQSGVEVAQVRLFLARHR